jgi:hypothetical protein
LISGDYEKPRRGTNVAFLWGALNVGCWAYVYFFIPELKGLQLENVDELYPPSEEMTDFFHRFESKIAPRHTPGWQPTVSYKEEHELGALSSGSGDSKSGVVVSEVEITK